MFCSKLWLCILLLCCVALNDAWWSRRRSRRRVVSCSSKRSCVSCTSHKSWSGQPCRWCPRTGKCHAHGAVLTNKCSRTENVVDPKACSSIVIATYDRSLAYKMVFLSALAYADNVATYIPRATEVNSFRLVKQVTKSCGGKAKCSGFVAVSHRERAIAVAFRGSETTTQILVEALTVLTVPKVSFPAGGKVQKYFRDAFNLIWTELKSYVYSEIRKYSSYKVWVTGHSLGGAIASLASTIILHERQTSKANLYMYTFGQPRVGDYSYALSHDRLVPISFRVTHYRDPAVHLPTCTAIAPGTPCIAKKGSPYHHGKEIYYGTDVMTKYSSYKTCTGLPYDEDMGCSNNPAVWLKCFKPNGLKQCTADHTHYFGIRVGLWWSQ